LSFNSQNTSGLGGRKVLVGAILVQSPWPKGQPGGNAFPSPHWKELTRRSRINVENEMNENKAFLPPVGPALSFVPQGRTDRPS
jgi:hypothetical protein